LRKNFQQYLIPPYTNGYTMIIQSSQNVYVLLAIKESTEGREALEYVKNRENQPKSRE